MRNIFCVCWDGMSASSSQEDRLSTVIADTAGIGVYASTSGALSSRSGRREFTRRLRECGDKNDSVFLAGKSAGARHLIRWVRENGATLRWFPRWAVFTVDPSSPWDLFLDMFCKRPRLLEGTRDGEFAINVYHRQSIPRGLLVEGYRNFEALGETVTHMNIIHSVVAKKYIKNIHRFLTAG